MDIPKKKYQITQGKEKDMVYWLLAVIMILSVIVVILLLKIHIFRKSADEIRKGFEDRLAADTNTVIDISSGDGILRELAVSVNRQLKVLRTERRRFRQGDAELKNAVTGISHDLRTPLTAISGYLQLMEKEENTENVRRYIDIIRGRTQEMTALTDELFRYSMVLSKEEDGHVEKTVVNDVLEESIAALYAVLCEAGISPDIRITEKKIIRTLDTSSLSRVFSNLINNAVKYSDGNLCITLGDSGEVTFENTAFDLDEVRVNKLFDRFYTVNTAKKSTGLGLAITRTLVEQMNGTISASYEKGRLRICVSFPEGA